MASGFFPDPAEDDDLESRNRIFWEALISHVRRDGFDGPPRRVLDVGCHRGGLLALIAGCWKPRTLFGIEPLDSARARAHLRLRSLAEEVVLLTPTEWHRIEDRTVDLLVCHEVLFLVPDLGALLGQIARVLARRGRAYVATGCHSENPLWPDWKAQLDQMGHETYSHQPMDVMAASARAGLLPSVRPLRDNGWATHDPTIAGFTFPTVAALLDHQFRHKLLFRLVKP